MKRFLGLLLLLAGALWLASGQRGIGQDEPWAQSGDTISLANAQGRVGIGTDAPQAKVHIVPSADSVGLLVENELGQKPSIQGKGADGSGVEGISLRGIGISGLSNSSSGVQGDSVTGSGVRGLSGSGAGVEGASATGPGVEGSSDSNVGVMGFSVSAPGLQGVSSMGTALDLRGFAGTYLIQAWDASKPGGTGLTFQVVRQSGEVWARGAHASAAHGVGERFGNLNETAFEAGDVLSIQEDGTLQRSHIAYETSVVGVYATDPGFVGGQAAGGSRGGVVVAGVAVVKASAENGAIVPGDLLTTASLEGRVMRCQERTPCFGALVGKALEPLASGQGMIRILVTLQ